MSKDYAKMVKEAMLNNTFDDGVMSTALKQTWFNSYSYLLYLQQANIEYEELCYYSGDKISRVKSHIGDLYLNKSLFACFDIDYDIIECCDREEYRTSEYYQSEMTIYDLVYNQSIFKKIPIVIIDDSIIWDFKLKVTKDNVTFTLPFKRSFVLTDEYDEEKERYKYVSHKIQIRIINNAFYDRYTFNKNTIGLKSDKTITINKATIQSITINNIQVNTEKEFINKYGVKTLSDLDATAQRKMRDAIKKRNMMADNYEKVGTMMCSIHFINNLGKNYELGTTLIPMEDNGTAFVGELTDDIYEAIRTDNLQFFVSMVFIPYLHSHVFYTGRNYSLANNKGSDLMVLEESPFVPYTSPIPVENFMVFKKDANKTGYILESNKEMLELHYPNIYRFKDINMKSNDRYKVFFFYYEMPELKYTCMFDFYFKFLQNKFNLVGSNTYVFNKLGTYGNTTIVEGTEYSSGLFTFEYGSVPMEKIINDMYYQTADFKEYTEEQKDIFYDIFKKIYDYKFYHHQYGETDFLYRYIHIEGHEFDEPFEYKVNTMRDWVKVQPWTLRDYVLEQNKLGTSYHLFTNTLDLKGRIRTNTSKELGDKRVITFKESMYVFAFNNDTAYPDSLDMRVFVDGLMAEIYQYRKLYMDYIYIPTRLITKDSYIEVEIFPSYKMKETINFESINDSKEITLLEVPDDIFPTTEDLYYQTEDHTELIDPNSFEITTHTERGDVVVSSENPNIEPVRFTRLKTYNIKPKSSNVVGKNIEFSIRKFGEFMKFTVQKSGYLIIKFTGAELSHNFSVDYLRIFDEEGRLIPRMNYQIYTFYNKPYIYFFRQFKAGDVITIDFTPYHYTEICHIENISKDTTLIDLKDYIDKPFDIRYYDIYLNGRKLSLNNVFVVSPYQITLVNIKSVYNLDIYERERDWEFFGLDYHEHLYYFTFNDLIESGALLETDKNELIKWVIDTKKDSRLNIYPNTNKEKKQERSDSGRIPVEWSVYYFGNLLPKKYINPDTYQESDYILNSQFKEIDEVYRINKKTIMLDPDILVAGENHNIMTVYPIGHLNEVPESILDPIFTFFLAGTINSDAVIFEKGKAKEDDDKIFFKAKKITDDSYLFSGSIEGDTAVLERGSQYDGITVINHGNLAAQTIYNDAKRVHIKTNNPIEGSDDVQLYKYTYLVGPSSSNDGIVIIEDDKEYIGDNVILKSEDPITEEMFNHYKRELN